MRARSRLLLALVATTACGGGTAAGGGGGDRRATRLAYYERSDPRSLDPALSTDVPTGEMVTLAFDGLTQFDPDGRLLPALADRWTARRDGRRYVFHLRAGVRFHDGTPVTARAVRTSFLRVLSPASRGGRTWPLYPIAGAEDYAAGRASDVRGLEPQGDSAVAFTLREPLAIFPTFLAMPVASVVPVPVPPDLGQHPVGSGPWRFVAWRHDDELVFARNGDYWGGAPVADTLAVRIVPEALTRAAEFEAGRLSVVEVPFGETTRWREAHPDWLVETPALRVVYVALNTRRGPLADVRLLAQAGYPDGLRLELWRTAANAELSAVAQAIQSQLAGVGVRVELIERDASSQREAARKGETDMVILDWWADYPDADNF